MTDLKRRLRPLDGFDPSMSWEEVRGRGMHIPLGAPARSPRRRIAVIAAALAVSVTSFAWLSTAFRDPDRATPRSGGDTYVFSDITVGPSTREPERTQVGFRTAWSGAEYPGEHRCEFTIANASGGELLRESVIVAAHTPDGMGRSYVEFPTPIDGEPATATITCSPERLDSPVAFDIVDVRLDRVPGAVLMTYTATAPADLVDPAYPGTNACTAWLELPGTWHVERSFTLTAPGGSEHDASFGQEQVQQAIDDGLFDQLSGGVDCHPFTAADVPAPSRPTD